MSASASASAYPAVIYSIPIRIHERLPPSVQSLDLETLMMLHCLLALISSLFTIHPSYALPLALTGLVLTHPSLFSHLPHFLPLWLISLVFDVLWLLYKSSDARTLVGFCTGAGMVVKMVSLATMGVALSNEGYGGVSSRGGTGGGGLGSGAAAWMSAGLGGGGGGAGGWSANGGLGGSAWRGGRGVEDEEETLPGGYSTVYDDPEDDAPPRHAAAPSSNSHHGRAGSGDAHQVQMPWGSSVPPVVKHPLNHQYQHQQQHQQQSTPTPMRNKDGYETLE